MISNPITMHKLWIAARHAHVALLCGLASVGCTTPERLTTKKVLEADVGYRLTLPTRVLGCYAIVKTGAMSARDSTYVVSLNPIALDSTRIRPAQWKDRHLAFTRYDATDDRVGRWGVDSLSDTLRWNIHDLFGGLSFAGLLQDSLFTAHVQSSSDVVPYVEQLGEVTAKRIRCPIFIPPARFPLDGFTSGPSNGR